MFSRAYYCIGSHFLCSSSISTLKYKYLCKIHHNSSTIICTYFSIYSLNFTFRLSEFVSTCFLIYSLNITFLSSEYTETIIHIFHSFLHGNTVVIDNGVLLFIFYQFFDFHKKLYESYLPKYSIFLI